MASDEARKIAMGLHPLERKVLPHLKDSGLLSDLAIESKLQDVEATRALQWLEGKACVKLESVEEDVLAVTEKGKQAFLNGLPEEHALWALQRQKEVLVDDLKNILPAYDKDATGAVIGALKRLHVPFGTTKDGKPKFTWVDGLVLDEPLAKRALAAAGKTEWKLRLAKLDERTKLGVQDLLKRQGYAALLKRRDKKYVLTPLGKDVTKTKEATTAYEERLTPQMLSDGSWRKKKFRPYNVAINVPKKTGGKAHFVNDAIADIKRVWLDMGFEEMEGDHVQTAFWDLDALFVPQDHPAREMQDTFYLANPEKGVLPKEVLPAVKAAHEHGGTTGSLGWRAPFNDEESAKLLLRTHTTVLSAHTLDAIRQGKAKMPGKYFSVSTIYRNEALDWKHLFELHQVEGIVVDESANFQHLKGYLRAFFGKMGFSDVRIRPAHFPYTEPSAEVDVWDDARNCWVELGGAGIFRPEVTKTLIGKEIPVLAWGIGMERTIMRHYQLDDIRVLYNNDLEQLKNMKTWMR